MHFTSAAEIFPFSSPFMQTSQVYFVEKSDNLLSTLKKFS
jgi:hypothetical protein